MKALRRDYYLRLLTTIWAMASESALSGAPADEGIVTRDDSLFSPCGESRV